MSAEASTSAASTSSGPSEKSVTNGDSTPGSPASSTSSLPTTASSKYDPAAPFQAPLGAELDRDPSIDGTSVGAGSAYEGSSQVGTGGIRKQRLEDIDQDEREVCSLFSFCSRAEYLEAGIY